MNARNRVLVLVFITILLLSTVPALPTIAIDGELWFKTIGGGSIDEAHSIFVDQNYVYVAGTTYSFGQGISNAFIARLNLNGDLQWFKTISGGDNIYAITIYQGNMYVTGDRWNGQDADAFIAKLDLSGNLQWFKTIGENYLEDRAYSIVIDQDSIYIAGGTGSYGALSTDAFVAKLDLNGNLQWLRIIGGDNIDFVRSVIIYQGDVYITGPTLSFGNTDFFIARLDSNGNLQWFKVIDSSNGQSIIIYQGDIYVVGSTNYGVGILNAFIAKLDLNGNLLWFKTIGGNFIDEARSISIDQGNIYMAGYTQSFGSTDAFIAKLDLNGDLLWFKTISGRSVGNTMVINQGDIYVAGKTRDYGAGSSDAFITKLNDIFAGQLCWTQREGWPNVQVSKVEPVVTTPAPLHSSPEPSTSMPEPALVDLTDQVQTQSHAPVQHLAVPCLQAPVADFTWNPANPLIGQVITFDASASFDLDGNIVNYDWDFGDGNQAQGQIVQHIYNAPGIYDVTLTVTDDDGLTDEITKQVTVLQPPVADFTWDPANPAVGQQITFDASNSFDPDGYIASYEWDFGDGTQAQGQVVQHTYQQAGIYDVTLTATDDDGLTDQITKQVTVQQLPIFPYMLTLGTRRPETLAGLFSDDGNAYVAGTTNRRIPYLASFDAFTGQLNFAKIFQPFRRAYVDGVKPIGNEIFVFGHYRNAFLASFSQQGDPLWLMELGPGRRMTRINDIERYIGMASLDAYTIYAVGQWDGTRRETRGRAFLAKITGNQVEWIKAIDTRYGDTAKAISIIGNEIYVIGTTYSRGRGDAFIAKFDLNGNLQDYLTFGGRRIERVKGALYYQGNLYIVGDTKSFGRDKVFVAKLPIIQPMPHDGDLQAITLDIGRREYSFGIAGGSIYIAGQVSRDSFFVKLSPDTLEIQDAKLLRGPRYIWARAIAYENAVLLAGYTSIGEGRGDAFLSLLTDGFEGTFEWPEGWHVSVAPFQPSWQPFGLQAVQRMPNIYGLEGYSVREFGAWNWDAVVHMSGTED